MADNLTRGNVTIRWHKHGGQWMKTVGKHLSKDKSSTVRADFYLGTNADEAIIRASALVEQWRARKKKWPELRPRYEEIMGQPCPDPFWPPKGLWEAVEEIDAKSGLSLLVESASKAFLAEQERRLKMMGTRSLKPSTVSNLRKGLAAALRATDEDGRRIIPDALPVSMITEARISETINAHYMSGGVRERTALNYCRTLRQFLNWLHGRGWGYRHPDSIDNLFKLRVPQPEFYVPTVKEVALLLRANEHRKESKRGNLPEWNKMKLFMLLAINCGFYEIDISNLRHAEIIQHAGRTCIWRKRDKTSHQNNFSTLHALWPETVAALMAELAPSNNRHGRALLNHDGAPIKAYGENYHATSAATQAFRRARGWLNMKKDVKFMGLRKFTATMIKMQTREDDLARMFLGQKLVGSLSRYVSYRKDDFAPLTAALDGVYQTLREGEAFPAVKVEMKGAG